MLKNNANKKECEAVDTITHRRPKTMRLIKLAYLLQKLGKNTAVLKNVHF